MRSFGRSLALAILAAAAVFAIGLPFAGGAESANPVQVNPLAPANQESGKPVTLGAKVVDTTNGRPVSNVEVTFLVQTDVFGPRLMNIGKAVTDATGSAYVLYKPSWVGDTNVVLRFLGNSQYTAAEGKLNFNAIGPAHIHENARFGLEPVRAVAPFVVAAVVLAVWGALIFTVIHTVRGIGFSAPVPQLAGEAARRRRQQPAEASFADAGEDPSVDMAQP
jgi:hypothetical protein